MNKFTHHNNELNLNNVGEMVSLKGWVSKTRDLGGLIFFDLRDKYGITQIIVHPNNSFYEIAKSLRQEYVVTVKGEVVARSSINKDLKTGEIEINATEIRLLNKSKTPPIYITDSSDESEEVTLKYRYLDLRKPKMQKMLYNRHLIMQAARKTLINNDFLEIETPILAKSTPEGARDYLVPSRLYPNSFYALPQSPQIYKQMLMVGGFERYFQIARCFRDEDLRSDRQPEFTQIDIEASFIDEEDIMGLSESIMKNIFKDVLDIELKKPFMRIKYQDAMLTYGSDKPLVYIGMPLIDMSTYFNTTDFPLLNNQEMIRGFVVESNNLTRKEIDVLTNVLKQNHGTFLGFLKNENGNYTGSMSKWLIDGFNHLEEGKMLFVTAGDKDNVLQSLGAVRLAVAKTLNLIDENVNELLWVVDFPLYIYDKEEERYVAAHHPFTQPSNINTFTEDRENALARSYDLVWNGYEVAGGSIRINDYETQIKMFEVLGFSKEDIKRDFGFFTEALSYGTPPHGGIAFGLDRIAMLVNKTSNIRDVIAFPKTQNAKCLMVEAPGLVSDKQLEELKIKIEVAKSE